MSDYHRTTRECSVSQLQPELRRAVQNYFQEQNLGDPDADSLICCETISTRKNSSGLFSLLKGTEDATIHTGMLFTSACLIWVRKGDRSEVVLTAANLKEIRVKTYLSILTKDAGLEIAGCVRDSQNPVRGYVGMGPELAAQRFCEEVGKAVSNAQPQPAPKKFPKWLGG